MNKGIAYARGVASFVALLLLVACGATTSGSSTSIPTISVPTSTPSLHPTTTPTPTPWQWFSEHFDEGMPPGWIATSGWTSSTSSVLAEQGEQIFHVPGTWSDLEIHARLQCGPEGWSSIGFRNSDDNYYQLSYNQDTLVLSRHYSGQVYGQELDRLRMTACEGWHEVVIRIVGGDISVRWDGELIFDVTDTDPVGPGDIFVQNWDNSLYEVDLLEVSPPGGLAAGDNEPQPSATPRSGGTGPIPATNTPVSSGQRPGESPGSATDLVASSGYLDGRGVLRVVILNSGPHAYTGTLGIQCTLWYVSPGSGTIFGMGDSVSVFLVLEPGQTSDQQSGCRLDNSQGAYYAASFVVEAPPSDPDMSNNYLNVGP